MMASTSTVYRKKSKSIKTTHRGINENESMTSIIIELVLLLVAYSRSFKVGEVFSNDWVEFDLHYFSRQRAFSTSLPRHAWKHIFFILTGNDCYVIQRHLQNYGIKFDPNAIAFF